MRKILNDTALTYTFRLAAYYIARGMTKEQALADFGNKWDFHVDFQKKLTEPIDNE